jgi:hypothetical protein
MSGTKEKIKLEKKRFQSRMVLAYISMFSIIIFTVLLWFFVPTDRLEIVTDMSFYLYFALSGIIGAAMGLKTIEKTKWSKE